LSNQGANTEPRASDHLANERTYLAWVRTGVAVIALGFVVAKFGLLIRELAPSAASSTSSYGFSSIVGVALVLVGGLLQLVALRKFTVNQERIRSGKYEPSKGLEILISTGVFIVALALIAYMLLTI
jgi:putative membrane protein